MSPESCDAGPVVAGSSRGQSPLPGILAYDAQGVAVDEFPKSLYGNTDDDGAPVIGDFDGDGLVDIAATITDASYGGVIG